MSAAGPGGTACVRPGPLPVPAHVALTRGLRHNRHSLDDDAELIRGILAGRREDFDVLVERYQRSMYALAYRLTHDHRDAADIVQATFLQAYTHLAQFRGEASFVSWLRQIVLNECRALRRGRPAQREVPLDETADAYADTTPSGWRHTLASLVTRLPPRQRHVLILRIHEDLPFKEIARLEGITENAAKVNYHHAVTRLRKWLEDKPQ
jgi:RNA polymerase sigma-70 factor (ECF subfamily)